MRFRKLTVWERLIMVFMPAKRREYEKRLYAAMKWLMDHPDEPVISPE